MHKTRLSNGAEAWALSPSKYVSEVVNNVEMHLAKKYGGMRSAKRATLPFHGSYMPELDITPGFDPKQARYYQTLIGVVQWIVKLGMIYIITGVNSMAVYMDMPREGHLECLFLFFAHLKIKHNSRMVFDPTYPTIDLTQFKECECEWKHFYPQPREQIPDKAPNPRGKDVDLNIFVDSDHTGDSVTRRSRTGIFIFLNMAHVSWYSKKQITIETSVFGA